MNHDRRHERVLFHSRKERKMVMWKYTYADMVSKARERMRERGSEEMLDLGSETKMQNRLNREYMDRITFEMRVLRSDWADISTELLGQQLPSPIISCSFDWGFRLLQATVGSKTGQYQDAGSMPYFTDIARAMAQVNTLFQCTVPPQYMQEIFDMEGARVIHTVAPYHTSRGSEDELIEFYMRDSEARGAVAIAMDVSCFFGEKVGDEWPYSDVPQAPKSVAQLRRYREATRLPFVVNGVLSVHDAQVCFEEVGADAIVVGHHYGEIIDYAVPILKILPEIRAAFPDATILADTGFMRGTDVLKALALGANGVAILEPIMLAYMAYGFEGVMTMYDILCDELRRTMSLTGCQDIASIDPSILHFLD